MAQRDGLKGAERVNPYGDDTDKTGQVRRMFDNIAPAYDLMNTLMSFGLHRRWRDKALRYCAQNGEPRRVLDIATGTGDVAFRMAELWPDAVIKGVDLSPGMLEIASGKLAGKDPDIVRRVSFATADCLDLDEKDDSYDLVTVAYGVRNFARLEQGYREMLRVLRPGGTLCVIELSCPPKGLARKAYDLYSRNLIPLAGRLASGDSRAYSYLPESIAAAPQRRQMALVMRAAGFRRCRWISLTMGAVTIYLATKPDARQEK